MPPTLSRLARAFMLSDDSRSRVTPKLGGHLPVLDGLRGIAILLVLFHHFLPETLGERSLVQHALHELAMGGWAGVDLFFVLSGFLITGILLDAKGERRYFLGFYGRRILRILPVYYLLVALTVLVIPLCFPEQASARAQMSRDQGWYWGHLVNFYIVFVAKDWPPFATGHLWSLAVEEQFYAFWPLVVFLLDRRKLLGVVVAILVGCPVLRALLLWTDVPSALSFRSGSAAGAINYMLIPFRLDGLAYGALVAVLARSVGLERLITPARWVVVLTSLALVAIQVVVHGDFTPTKPIVQTLGYEALAGLSAGVIVLCLTHGKHTIANIIDSRLLRFFGKYSYAMYAFHMIPVILLKRTAAFELTRRIVPDGILLSIVYTLLLVAITTSIALLSFHLVEKRFLALKRFVPRGEPVKRAGAESVAPSSSR